jgi:molybdopterin converting factor small subunit
LQIDLGEGARLSDLKRALEARKPALQWPVEVMWAINQEYVRGEDAALKDGDEVAIIPPVSGG